MNFKDAYKSCNDDIRGNREILAAILGGEQVKKKKFNFKPLMACAAMVIVICCVGYLGFGPDNFSGSKPKLVATTDGIKTPPSQGSAQNSSDDANQDVTLENGDTAQDKSGDEPSDKMNGAGDDKLLDEPSRPTAGDEASDEHVSRESEKSSGTDENEPSAPDEKESHPPQQKAEPEVEATPMPGEDMEVTDASVPAPASAMPASPSRSSAAYSGGGGGGASASGGGGASGGGSKSAGEYKTITLAEYFDYLGLNIIQKGVLPSDMHFEPGVGVTVEIRSGEIVSDVFSITAFSSDNPERLLSLTVSKSNPKAKSYVSGKNLPKVTEEATMVTAYMMADDVSLCVNAKNFTGQEVLTFMNSLKK